jgi:site-specific DNA-methyltransferase (adenine-specific)
MPSLYYSDDYVTLYHGDCLTEHREWLDADVLVTDPPYGVAYTSGRVEGRKRNTTGIRNDKSPATRDSALEAWGERPSVTFGSWRVPKPANTRQVLIWDKGTDLGVGDLSLPWGGTFEEIYILGRWPKLSPGGARRDGGTPSRSPAVLRHNKPNVASPERPNHPTPKPVPLMERLIEKCPPGVIADPFAGSGATLIAAKNLGRKVIGVELEEKYCEMIAKRCSQEVLDFGDAA